MAVPQGDLTGGVRAPAPFDFLTDADVTSLLETACAEGAPFAEVFVERRVLRHLRMEEGAVRAATQAVEAGVGVRVVAGGGTGTAHTSEPTIEAIRAAASAAGRAAAGPIGPSGAEPARAASRLGPGDRGRGPASSWEPSAGETAGRAAFLAEVDARARGSSPKVVDVSVSLTEESRRFLVANTHGALAGDDQILTTLTVTAYARAGRDVQKGHHGGGGRERFEDLAAGRLEAGAVAEEAVRRALVLTEALPAPAGEMPVVIGNGWGGVLLHEAIGHGFEADFVRRGTSIYAGRLGQVVASPLCTVVDDGSLAGLRGSFARDDEGTTPRRTVLVERGRVAGYLHDLLSAGFLGSAPTGNGRRHSFRTPPIPRQTNIFLEAGPDAPEEIIRSVERGLYAKSIGGGQVDIVNGNFVFQVTEGYLIEQGRITAPVKGANLIGTGHEVLGGIARVGCDFAFDPGIGVCGKDGQSQPVGVGQPTVLVSAMTVGGTRL